MGTQDFKSFSRIVSFACFFMSIVGIFFHNFVYFYMPEARDGATIKHVVIANGVCVVGILISRYLYKYSEKS